MSAERLEGRLAGIVGSDHIFTAESCATYAVDDRVPRAVVFPADAQQLSEIMKLASSERLSVVPRGNGTKIGFGGIPSNVDLVVGLTRLTQVIDHEPGDLTATFQTGIPLRDVQTTLCSSGQFLPLDPAHCEHATIGGILATNSSGPWRHRYGAARDLVIGIRVVHADGTLTKGGAKVVKSVSGYDMNKLYIGSLGTLGIILEATFKLSPRPIVERTWIALFQTGEAAADAIARILRSPLVCTRVELLSSVATQSVGRQAGCVFAAGTVAVAASVGSTPEAVDVQIAAIDTLCRQAGAAMGCPMEGGAQDDLWKAVCDSPSASGDAPSWVTLKASVPLTKVVETIHRAEALGRDLDLESAAVSEAGCGIIRIYWTAQTGLRKESPASIARGIEELRSWTLRYGGSLVILSAPPSLKADIDAWGPVGSALSLMQRLKQQFDPHKILNPGRFVGNI